MTSAVKRDPELDALVVKFGQQYGNCAQTSFSALQEGFNLPCDKPSFLRALTAFPGMGGTGETCGGVSGAVMAMGLALGPKDTADKAQSAQCHAAAHQFCLAVTKEFGSTDCGDVIERCCGRRYDLSKPEEARQYAEAGGLQKCVNVVQTAVNIAAGIMEGAAVKGGAA
jgi:C_GCAxxG_C_C family probable redox protein